MSSGIPSPVKEAHQDLGKHIGCMNVIFQLFDRQHFFTGKRAACHNNKTGANHDVEPRIATEKEAETNESYKILSSSSPCSSTPSSLNRNKTAKPESPKIPEALDKKQCKSSVYLEDRTLSVKTGGAKEEERIRVPKQHVDSPRPLQQSPDLRDVVKNSMYREARILSAKEGSRVHVMKHVDSPRPLQHSKLVSQDPRRFSYDGRESREASKSTTMKLVGELPRLSLDSQVRSVTITSSASEARSNFLVRNPHEDDSVSVGTPTAANREFGSHRRSSSVVAKLMGLEGFPEAISVDDDPVSKDRFVFVEDSVPTSQIPSQNQETRSPQVSRSPHFRPTKPTSYSRCPLELAPWRRSDSGKAPRKPSSVYGEVAKRINELQLDKSGKDLRALKQILEAMQKTRAKLENQTQERVDFDYGCPELSMQQRQQCNPPSPMEKRSSPLKRSKSSDPIKQPAELNVQVRDNSTNQERKTLTPRKHIDQRRSNTSKGSEHMNGGRNPALKRSPGAVSPRQQKKKFSTEKQSHTNIPQSEQSRIRRNPNKPKESASPNRRQKPKPSNQQQSYSHISEVSSDTASMQSESNNSSASYMETEVTSRYHNIETGAKQQVIHKETNSEVRMSEDTLMAELAMATIEQPSPVSVLDATFYIEDSPSPVRKKISKAFGDANEAEWHTEELDNLPFSSRHNLGSEFNHKNLENIEHLLHKLRLLNSTPCEDAMNRIVPFYQSDNSDHRYIAKILLASGLLKDLDCISTTAQLHPPGNLINPNLFHVLEQTEESTWLTCKGPKENIARINFEQKIHRKVVFDTVNEILVHKLALEGSLMQERSLSSQHLLKEFYTEMDHLKPESYNYLGTEDDGSVKIIKGDLKHELEDWVDHRGELPALVLDIERLIFKDLITEVISREVPWLQDRTRRHSRKLFTN